MKEVLLIRSADVNLTIVANSEMYYYHLHYIDFPQRVIHQREAVRPAVIRNVEMRPVILLS